MKSIKSNIGKTLKFNFGWVEKINVCVIKEKLRSTEIFLIMICDILNNIKFECNSNIDIS